MHIDVNDAGLAAVWEVLPTGTTSETVTVALSSVAASAARRRDLERLVAGDLPDVLDRQIMRSAWQR